MRSHDTSVILTMFFLAALVLGVALQDKAIQDRQKQQNLQMVELVLKRWTVLFNKLDSNKDGLLSKDELRNEVLERNFCNQDMEVVEFLWTHLERIGHVAGKYRFGDDDCPEYWISKADLHALPATAQRLWGK